jgi:hypothetical protein
MLQDTITLTDSAVIQGNSISIQTGEVVNYTRIQDPFNSGVNTAGQLGQCLIHQVTTNGTTTEMFLDGPSASKRLELPNNATWKFTIDLIARRLDATGEAAGFRFEGIIDRAANTSSTRLIGIPSRISEQDSAVWDVDVDADTTNGSLRVRVTGEAGKAIRWIGFVQFMEVSNL